MKHTALRLNVALATLFLAIVFLTLPAIMPARAAVKIQEVTSDSGVTAWLVEDYTVPIITIRFAFEGGSTQDPAGKEGLANLMTGLFDEGAGDMNSDAFQVRLDDAGAEMRFTAGRDAIYGVMRMLEEQRDEAFGLLKLAVEKPRFDQAPIDRIRSQIVAGIVAGARDPGTAAGIAWKKAIYGDHPYARQEEGTEATLGLITPDDIRAFHRNNFARENLYVGVVGAIDAESLKKELDRVFGGLPEKANLAPVGNIVPKLAQELGVKYDLPQTSLTLAYPGIERDDPLFFSAYLMNHILGGGAFSSRLFNEVREIRGLAYSVDSSLVNYKHASALIISTATRSDRAAETLKIIRDEVKRMAEGGATEAELEAAKKYVIGAYAINNLDNSGAIANTLVDLQLEDLGMDYIDRREDIINSVTVEQVAAAAKKLLNAEPATMVVGPALAGGE
ncbi:MAG TPA: pitrilysin family protein [Rhizobiaceae bacterium]|nr:pitrilysin family protein [Rhizobiaceae bacterium]